MGRESAFKGGSAQIRRPLTRVMLRRGRDVSDSCGVEGYKLWLCLWMSCYFLSGASERFSYSNGKFTRIMASSRGDVASERTGVQLFSYIEWHTADSVELSFPPSKGD